MIKKIERRAKLKWRCRRGMLELDLMLLPFAEAHLAKLNEAQLITLEKFLEQPDPLLFSWLMGHVAVEDEFKEIVRLIQS